MIVQLKSRTKIKIISPKNNHAKEPLAKWRQGVTTAAIASEAYRQLAA
jgi:hypothetical protein